MKKPFVALLLLIGAAAMLATTAFAQTEDLGIKLVNAKMAKQLMSSRAARLGVSAGLDPDTVYVGQSSVSHVTANNYWNIYTGTYLPGTVAGDNSATGTNAYWDWDRSWTGAPADSLRGWWPEHRQYNAAGGLTLVDTERPWWALDHGNVLNYVISAGPIAQRTFGVVGLWHKDPGGPGNAVMWTPLSGSNSAWCGMREHGDLTVKDALTKQAFNQDIVRGLHDGTSAGGGSGNRFPGYADQMDQMLYRDITVTNSQSLTVSFLYRTRMATNVGTATATRTGWFHGDPLSVTVGGTNPNFISNVVTSSAPQDSFMVYVGAPVNDADVSYSDVGVGPDQYALGSGHRPVYDKHRRWFDEVIKVFGAGNNYFEIFKTTGNNPADTLDATPGAGSSSIVVPAANITSILNGAASGPVRLVFRVKTNRGFADSDTRGSGYTSFGRGAVLLDDVSYDIGAGPVGPAGFGDFETADQAGTNSIDNRFDTEAPGGVNSVNNWRSTGKPPGNYFHIAKINDLTYDDLCGPVTSPTRVCNINGNVLTAGNHDDGENAGDSRYTPFREISQFATSPTINLIPTLASGPIDPMTGLHVPPPVPNDMGITDLTANASDDYVIWYDLYAGMFNLTFTGESWVFGHQSYPATQQNGAKIWGQPRFPGFIVFNPEPQCFTDAEPFFGNGQPMFTSNASGIPDSLRIYMAHQQQCFRFAVSLGCNSNAGGHFDNVSLAFIDVPGVEGQANAVSGGSAVTVGGVSSDIWQFVNDTFPFNETVGIVPTAAFDTTSGLIRTGLNNAANTGNLLRFDIPGDSSSVVAGNASGDPGGGGVRVDLMFRILPGPGNYQTTPGRTMVPGSSGPTTGGAANKLLKLPTDPATLAVASALSSNFWERYLATPGDVSGGVHNGNDWDPTVWNSARMDTTQVNVFPVTGVTGTGLGGTTGNGWMTEYHEADLNGGFGAGATLGISKNRCFTINPAAGPTTGPGTANNTTCGAVLPYPPTWVTANVATDGYDGSTTTKEFTKILPDGLFTPGTHVAYFYRKSLASDPLTAFTMCPDTNFITPQSSEGSSDQHRWQQFSVLPDRWKATAFGGAGDACMLYIDINDRRGNEGRFISVMDSLGATVLAKRGSHNGWTAPGTTLIGGLDVRTDASVRVSNKNAQPGTTFDMYGVKASESLTTSAGAPGSRLANIAGIATLAGRQSKAGPLPEQLDYYKIVALLSGDLNSGILGPFVNRSQNDIQLFTLFLADRVGAPHGMFVQGDGFGQAEAQITSVPAHGIFLTDKLGVTFRNGVYQKLSGNQNDCADVLVAGGAGLLSTTNDIYGVSNFCTWSNDVYNRNPAYAEATTAAQYENVGGSGPYYSDIVKKAVGGRNWVAVTSGYEIEHLFSRYCDTDNGRLAYYYYMLNNAFSGACQITGAVGNTLDTPQGGRGYANFMKIGNSVMRQGQSIVRLSVAKAGRVQVSIYDVTGRKIRNLADRIFPAGEKSLIWDGTDDGGSKVARGVYFVRSSVQKDAGRIIVLNN